MAVIEDRRQELLDAEIFKLAKANGAKGKDLRAIQDEGFDCQTHYVNDMETVITVSKMVASKRFRINETLVEV